jgi:hypothetical protein
MIPFDYALGLLTILMGLALAEVTLSFHKLAIRARGIHWDGRPLIAAAMVAFECVRHWFAQWTLRDSAAALTFPVYLGLFLQMLLLVLLAAASLPDDPDDQCDLGAFYERRRRYFWGLFTGYYLCFFIWWLIFGATNSEGSGPAGLLDWTRVLAPVLLLPLLMVVRRRWLDYLIPAGFIIFYAARYWHATLSAG